MAKFRRYLLPLLLVVLVLGLAMGFRSFFMAFLVRPISLLFWAIWRVIISVHQIVYWTILLLLCSVLAIRLLPPEGIESLGVVDKYHYRHPERVEYWRSLIKGGLTGTSERNSLRESMKRLLLSVLAQTERAEPMDLDDLVESGQILLPPRVHRYLVPAEVRHDDRHGAHVGSVFSETIRRLKKWPGNMRHDDEGSISETLSWMESRLEIHDDR